MAGPNEAALDLIIRLQDEASQGLDTVAKHGGFLKDALSFATGGLIAQGIGQIGGAITDFFKSSIGESQEWSAAVGQVDAVVKSTGGSAGITSQQLQDLANHFSGANGLSGYADDAILHMEGIEATFTNISAKVFPDATQAIIDVSAKMGGDMQGAAIQVGKALNDPVAGLSALTRIGVTFTDQQKEQIKTMMAAGDTMGAQKIIIGELGREFGGSALAQAQTFEGRMFTLGEQFRNVKQTIGDALIPVLQGLVGFISSPAVMGTLQNLADMLAHGITEGAQMVGQVFATIGPPLEGFIKFLVAMTDTSGGYLDFGQFVAGLPDPLQRVGQFIGEVVFNFAALFQDLSDGRGILESIVSFLGSNVASALAAFGVSGEALERVSFFFEDIAHGAQLVADFLGQHLDAVLLGLGAALTAILIPALITAGTTLVSVTIPAFWAVASPIIAAAAPIIALGLAVAGLKIAFDTNFLGIRDLVQPVLNALGSGVQTLITAFGQNGLAGVFAALPAALGPVLAALGTLASQLGTKLNEAITWIGQVGLPLLVAQLSQWATAAWQWVSAAVPPLLAQLGQWAGAIWNWFTQTGLPALVSTLVSWGTALWNWIGPMIGPAVQQLVTWATQLGVWLRDVGLPALAAQLGTWAKALIDWIGPMIPPLLTELGKLLGQLTGWIVNTALPAIVTQLAVWGGEFLAWVGPAAAKLPGELGHFLGQLTGWFVHDAVPAIQTWGLDMEARLWLWIQDAAPKALQAIGAFFSGLWTWITGTGAPDSSAKMGQTGTDMVQGLINGVGGMLQAAVTGVKDFFSGFLAGFNDAAGTKSPSTVFYAKGIDLIQGLINGIQSMWSTATGLIGNLGQGLLDAFNKVTGTHSPSTELQATGVFLMTGLQQGIQGAATLVDAALTLIGQRIVGWGTATAAAFTAGLAALPGLVSAAIPPLLEQWNGPKGLLTQLMAWVGGIPGVIGNAGSFWPNVRQAFVSLLQVGIPEALTSGFPAVITQWKEYLAQMVAATNAAVAQMKAAFQSLSTTPVPQPGAATGQASGMAAGFGSGLGAASFAGQIAVYVSVGGGPYQLASAAVVQTSTALRFEQDNRRA